jgi:hypothetical protein
MIKQCVFLLETNGPVTMLKMWPIAMSEGPVSFLEKTDFKSALCAVKGNSSDESPSYPEPKSVPGRFGRGTPIKVLTKPQAIKYLSRTNGNFPVDLLMFFGKRSRVSRLELDLFEKLALGSDSDRFQLLKSLDGFELYAHDLNSIEIRSLKKSLCFAFYKDVVGEISPGTSSDSLHSAWKALIGTSEAQIVTGYNKTIYYRLERAEMLTSERLCDLLSWDFSTNKVYKVGHFNPFFPKEFPKPPSTRSDPQGQGHRPRRH